MARDVSALDSRQQFRFAVLALLSLLHLISASVVFASLCSDQKYDSDGFDARGRQRIHNLAELGDLAAIEKELNSSSNNSSNSSADKLNARTKNGETALHLAAAQGHTGVMKQLMERKAVVESRSNQGWTPLMTVSFHGNAEAVHLLLQFKADASAKNEGKTALDLASERKHGECVKLLQLAAKPKQFELFLLFTKLDLLEHLDTFIKEEHNVRTVLKLSKEKIEKLIPTVCLDFSFLFLSLLSAFFSALFLLLPCFDCLSHHLLCRVLSDFRQSGGQIKLQEYIDAMNDIRPGWLFSFPLAFARS